MTYFGMTVGVISILLGMVVLVMGANTYYTCTNENCTKKERNTSVIMFVGTLLLSAVLLIVWFETYSDIAILNVIREGLNHN